MKMKRNTRKQDNGLLKIVLIAGAAYLLYKHFKLPKGTVTPGEPIITAWDDVPVQSYLPEQEQNYVDSPIDYYQVLRVNSEALSGLRRPVGAIPLTI